MWSRSQFAWRSTWRTVPYLWRMTVERSEFMRGEILRLLRQHEATGALPAQRSAYSLTIAESWTNSLLCMTVSDTINMKHDSLSLISEHTRWTHTITHTEESHMRSSDRHLITQLELKVIPEWLWISYSNITSAKKLSNQMRVSHLN